MSGLPKTLLKPSRVGGEAFDVGSLRLLSGLSRGSKLVGGCGS
jgi:hypothetical protein